MTVLSFLSFPGLLEHSPQQGRKLLFIFAFIGEKGNSKESDAQMRNTYQKLCGSGSYKYAMQIAWCNTPLCACLFSCNPFLFNLCSTSDREGKKQVRNRRNHSPLHFLKQSLCSMGGGEERVISIGRLS